MPMGRHKKNTPKTEGAVCLREPRTRRNPNARLCPIDEAKWFCKNEEDPSKFEKRWINPHIGFGLFTRTQFDVGDFLLEYSGKLSNVDSDWDSSGDYVFFFKHQGKHYIVDATHCHQRYGRFVNDAVGKEVNCKMKIIITEDSVPHLCLFATKKVDSDTELRYDYGVKNLPWRQKMNSKMSTQSDEKMEEGEIATKEVMAPEVITRNETSLTEMNSKMSTQADEKMEEDEIKTQEVMAPEVITRNETSLTEMNSKMSTQSDEKKEEEGEITTQEVMAPEVIARNETSLTEMNGKMSTQSDEKMEEEDEITTKEVMAPEVITRNETSLTEMNSKMSTQSDGKKEEEDEITTNEVMAPEVIARNETSLTEMNSKMSTRSDEKMGEDEIKTQEVMAPEVITRNEISDFTDEVVNGSCDSDCSDIFQVLCSSGKYRIATTAHKYMVGQSGEMEEDNIEIDYDDDTRDPTYIPATEDEDKSSESELESVSELKTSQKVQNEIASKQMPSIIIDTEVSTHIDEEEKVVIPTVGKTSEGKRIYDKRHCCYYCGELFAKISSHLENKHNMETEVIEVLAKEKGKKRRNAWTKIRNLGNFHHNVKVLSAKKGSLIVDRRPNSDKDFDKFLPCPYCLGFFDSNELWRHAKTCPLTENWKEKKIEHIKKASELLLQGSWSADSDFEKEFHEVILANMKKDEVLETVKKDKSLILLGANMLRKVGKSRSANVRQKVRELARLLIIMKESNTVSHTTFMDFVCPEQFDFIIKCVKGLCKSENDKETERGCPQYEKPTLALKLGHSLKKTALIKRGQALRNGDSVERKAAEDYLLLHESEWAEKISSHANQTIVERKFNEPDLLPLTEDVVNLRKFLLEEMKTLLQELTTRPDVTTWRQLALAALCRVTVFNKRRGGETGQMLLASYQNRISDWQETGNAEIISTLKPIEKTIMNRLQLVEILGKKNRKVPVLLTEDMIAALDCLVKTRTSVGILSNKYLFAAPSTENGYLKGWDALHEISKKAGSKRPELLTTTNLRKYIATVSQIVDLGSNQELEWLANHMGHNLSVHRQYYRLQEQTLELAKVSKLLIAADSGKCHEFAGKQLSDVTLDELPDAMCNENDDDFHDEVQESSTESHDERYYNEEDGDFHNGVQAGMSSSSEEEIEAQPRKNKPVSGRKTVDKVPKKRRSWSKEEKEILKKYFHSNLVNNTPPSKNDILVQARKCSKINTLLEDRGWKSIKYYVWNLVQLHKKKIRSVTQ